MTDENPEEVIALLRQLQKTLGEDFQKLEASEIDALRKLLPHVDLIRKLVPHTDYLVELAIDGKAARRVWQNNRARILGAAAVMAAILALTQGAERLVEWFLAIVGFSQ